MADEAAPCGGETEGHLFDTSVTTTFDLSSPTKDASLDISLDGGATKTTIRLDSTSLASSGLDLTKVTSDQLVTAVNTQIAASSSLKGKVSAAVGNDGRLAFTTTAAGAAAKLNVAGSADSTIDIGYGKSTVAPTGPDPARYAVAAVRSIIQEQAAARSAASIRMTVTVPTTIEAVIAACGTATAVGLRDRAIILLLARLGLRAADVWRLCLDDVDWRNARLRLHGKSRRSVAMPLPQDVGDAVLDYLERGRPRVAEDRVFLRVQAPITPLRSASEIGGIVARVLQRGGFTDLPRGAHMFRHALATNLLRSGSHLDAIGAVLRHRRPEGTAIYAKVDTSMLMEVAQSWPGDASC